MKAADDAKVNNASDQAELQQAVISSVARRFVAQSKQRQTCHATRSPAHASADSHLRSSSLTRLHTLTRLHSCSVVACLISVHRSILFPVPHTFFFLFTPEKGTKCFGSYLNLTSCSVSLCLLNLNNLLYNSVIVISVSLAKL